MIIILLGNAGSIHTVQWAKNLSEYGNKIHIISQHPVKEIYNSSVTIHILPKTGILGYFRNAKKVKKIIQDIKPDILNVHYASGYGTTARLVNFHPMILSVWGSDVLVFPKKSWLHKSLIKKNLNAADAIASTSEIMVDSVKKLVPKDKSILLTPFGVNTEKFSVYSYKNNRYSFDSKKNKKIVIGTVKTLSYTYGIDILIRAFGLLKDKLKTENCMFENFIELRIVGEGPDKIVLKDLVEELGLTDSVCFLGSVLHENVPQILANFDIFAALSRSESFGVAVIEASASSLPVIVTDIGGLPEVVLQNKTGLIVPVEDPLSASVALYKLVINAELRESMGDEGLKYVKNRYSWNNCTKIMINNYKKIINENKIRKEKSKE
jgi:glycosyltransferase involved in cell wall biosynthesis